MDDNIAFDQARTHIHLGVNHYKKGEPAPTIDHFQKASDIFFRINRSDISHGLVKNLITFGSDLLNKGDSKNAIKYYELIKNIYSRLDDQAAIEPDHVTTLTFLGTILIDLGELDTAIEHLQEALNIYSQLDNQPGLEPLLIFVYHNLGSAFSKKGEQVNAIQYYKKALNIFSRLDDQPNFAPFQAKTLTDLGANLIDISEVDEAIERLKDALNIYNRFDNLPDIEPDHANTLFNLGNALSNKGDLTEAIECYMKAHNIYSGLKNRPELRSFHVKVLKNLKIILIDKALSVSMEHLQVWHNIYTQFNDQPDLEPTRAHILATLGAILIDKGELDIAIQYLQDALKTYSELGNKLDQANALYNIGNALREKGDLIKAIEHYQEALDSYSRQDNTDLEPNRADILTNLALTRYSNGEPAVAIKHYHEALDIYSHYDGLRDLSINKANLLTCLGVTLFDIGEFDTADEHFQNALNIYSQFENRPDIAARQANVLGNLGVLQDYVGEPGKAIQHHEAARDIYSRLYNQPGFALDHAKALINLGTILFSNGELGKAVERYQEAKDILSKIGNRPEFAPTFAVLLMNLAGVLIDTGETTRAAAHCEQAEKLLNDPSLLHQSQHNILRAKLAKNMALHFNLYLQHNIWDKQKIQEWANDRSKQLGQILELALPDPSDLHSPNDEITRIHCQFHALWMQHSIQQNDYNTIPRVLAAVQGRELSKYLIDSLEHADLKNPALIAFIKQRKAIREQDQKIEKLHRIIDHNKNRIGFNDTKSSHLIQQLEHAQIDRKNLHEALPELQHKASKVGGFELLDQPLGNITLPAIKNILAPDQALIILIDLYANNNEVQGALVVPGAGKDPFWIPLSGLEDLALAMDYFSTQLGNRYGYRRSTTDDEPLMAADFDGYSVTLTKKDFHLEHSKREITICMGKHHYSARIYNEGGDLVKESRFFPGPALYKIFEEIIGDKDHETIQNPEIEFLKIIIYAINHTMTTDELLLFWESMQHSMDARFWLPLTEQNKDDKYTPKLDLNQYRHIYLTTHGDLYNLPFECSTVYEKWQQNKEHACKITHYPGLLFFAMQHNLIENYTPKKEATSSMPINIVSYTGDDHDTPWAEVEAEIVNTMHQQQHEITKLKELDRDKMAMLCYQVHIACHGVLDPHSPTIEMALKAGPNAEHLFNTRFISSNNFTALYVFLSACVAGQIRENHLGDMIGPVTALLLRGTRICVASLVAIGDRLTPLFVTLVYQAMHEEKLPLDEALTKAKRCLVTGNWYRGTEKLLQDTGAKCRANQLKTLWATEANVELAVNKHLAHSSLDTEDIQAIQAKLTTIVQAEITDEQLPELATMVAEKEIGQLIKYKEPPEDGHDPFRLDRDTIRYGFRAFGND